MNYVGSDISCSRVYDHKSSCGNKKPITLYMMQVYTCLIMHNTINISLQPQPCYDSYERQQWYGKNGQYPIITGCDDFTCTDAVAAL